MSIGRPTLLIVSPDPSLAQGLGDLDILSASNMEAASGALIKHEVALLLIDSNASVDAEALIKKALEADPESQALILASEKDAAVARCIKAGAVEVLPRPCDSARLNAALSRAGKFWKRCQSKSRT